jgi:hypothetical protein
LELTVLARTCTHADAWAAEGLVEMGLGRFGSSSVPAGIEAWPDERPRAVG